MTSLSFFSYGLLGVRVFFFMWEIWREKCGENVFLAFLILLFYGLPLLFVCEITIYL
jgi:hypothetical protein